MIEVVLNFVQVAWQLLCDFMQPQGHDGQTLAIAPVIIAGMIGAASSIANGIFGSSSASKERKANQAAIDRQRREARNWRDRFVNQDATQTAATSRMLTRMNNIIQKRNMAAAGKRAVIGGTGAVEAATQQANAEAMGNAMSDIVANHEARADKAEMQYQQTKSQLDAQETQMNAQAEAARRNAMAQAATGVVNSAASVIGAMGDDPKNIFDQAKQARGKTNNTSVGSEIKKVTQPKGYESPLLKKSIDLSKVTTPTVDPSLMTPSPEDVLPINKKTKYWNY